MGFREEVNRFESEVKGFLDGIAENAPPQVRDILFLSEQSSLGRAVVADLVDAIPFVGDAANVFRVRDAEKVGTTQSRRFSRQLIDLGLGILPDPVGGILDLVTPTNTITYLREGRSRP